MKFRQSVITLMMASAILFTSLVFGVSAQDGSRVYVLVHGAFQDSSGWDDVTPLLEAAGHTVVVVSLPGRGEDASPEQSLTGYRDIIIEAINQQDQPVILVGHSFGGISISEVAEAIPDRIASLVYLAAYLPQNGDSLVTLAENDHYSLLGQEGNFQITEDFTFASVAEAVFASAFCPDCTPEQAERVAESQLPEPLAPLGTPVTLSEQFEGVYKVYVLTAEDVVISPQLQAYMLSRTPVDRVFALNTGHAPYVSAPDALADVLLLDNIVPQ